MCDQENSIELPNVNLKNMLNKIIKNNINHSKFTIKIESGSNKGDNYIGVIYRATVTYDDNDCEQNGKNGKKLSIIIKIPPQNLARREQFFARPCFMREALAYDEIIPMFMNYQKEKGIIPIEGGFYEVSECLGTLTDDGFEGIFLKDLRDDNFKMFNRLDELDFNHCSLVMKALGKLHAISFALKDQNPEKIKPYKNMIDILGSRTNDDGLIQYLTFLTKRACDALDTKDLQFYKEKLEEMLDGKEYMEIFKELVDGEKTEPYAVICHGDCWNNNILYRYENDRPVECRLLDWQIARYASPVLDIMYYIFCCTTHELRSQHYENLLNVYYEELSKMLTRLGSDPEKLFSRKNFNEQLKKYGRFGVTMAIMLLPMLTSNAEDIPDLDELSEKLIDGSVDMANEFTAESTVDAYKKRIRDVVRDSVKYGYL